MTNPFDAAWQEPAKPAPPAAETVTNPVTHRLDQPGIYDLSAEDYHADPCIDPSASASICSVIVQERPIHAWTAHPRLNPAFEAEDLAKYDLGTVAHALMLGQGRDIVVIDAADWKKDATKAARADAVKAGKQPCLVEVFKTAEAMHKAGREQLADHEERDCFQNGKAEQTMLARVGGVWCRSMADYLHDDVPIIDDYKTTGLQAGADPDAFLKGLLNRAGDIQDPFYSKVLAEIRGIDWRDVLFRFVVQETSPPYALSVIVLDGQSRDFAAARADYAIKTFGDCLATGVWPGWAKRAYYGQIPGWAQVRWEERLQAEALLAALEEEGR
jgi:hypothetical protein